MLVKNKTSDTKIQVTETMLRGYTGFKIHWKIDI